MFPPDSTGQNDGLLLRVWPGLAREVGAIDNFRLKCAKISFVGTKIIRKPRERDYNRVEPLPGAPIFTETSRALSFDDLMGFQTPPSTMLHGSLCETMSRTMSRHK